VQRYKMPTDAERTVRKIKIHSSRKKKQKKSKRIGDLKKEVIGSPAGKKPRAEQAVPNYKFVPLEQSKKKKQKGGAGMTQKRAVFLQGDENRLGQNNGRTAEREYPGLLPHQEKKGKHLPWGRTLENYGKNMTQQGNQRKKKTARHRRGKKAQGEGKD